MQGGRRRGGGGRGGYSRSTAAHMPAPQPHGKTRTCLHLRTRAATHSAFAHALPSFFLRIPPRYFPHSVRVSSLLPPPPSASALRSCVRRAGEGPGGEELGG
eukprot:106492-Chlamydomonas_euryale.AAC.1